MKKSKKFLSVFCAVCMILAMAAPAFAADTASVPAMKALQIYVVEPDGSVTLVDTISAEDRMAMPQARMSHYSFSKMDYDNANDWVYKSAETVPFQDDGAKTLAKGQTVSDGDDCIGVYVHSTTLDTINLKVQWVGGDNTYYFDRGFNAKYDLELYFRDGETHDGGTGLYIDSGTTYDFIVSTKTTWGGYADFEVCPGTYTG